MGGVKYYERTRFLLLLIQKENTGNPKNLSRKLGVSERTLYRILEELKMSDDDQIEYSREMNSYVFVRK
ncbi:MAG: HTH domain-containing protein [Chitinophagales bacterium]